MLKLVLSVSLSLLICLQTQAIVPPSKILKHKSIISAEVFPKKNKNATSTSSSSSKVYKKGNLLIGAGIGFGSFGYYNNFGNSRGFAVPLVLNIDYLFSPIISLGPYVGFMTRSYKYRSGYTDRFNSFTIGGRANLHGTDLLNELVDLDIDKRLDLYASVFVGLQFNSFSDDNYRGNGYRENNAYPAAGSVLGARYYIAPNLGVYAEVGSGHYAYLTFGGTIRL